MARFILVSLAAGVLFAALDGVLNANPFAQKLLACYKPIARSQVLAVAGLAIDVAYGLLMAALFLLLRASLPGPPVMKGLSFGLIAWFFRVVMGVAGQWVMFAIPGETLLYQLSAGLVEMVLLGVFYGATLRA